MIFGPPVEFLFFSYLEWSLQVVRAIQVPHQENLSVVGARI